MLLGLLIAALIVIAILILNNKTKLEAQKKQLLDDVSEYLHKNYDHRLDNFISVFKDRLLTLEDEENIHFYDVGVVEHEIFVKNLTKFGSELKVEIYEALKLQHALASDFGILQKFIMLVDGYISLLISGTSNIAIGLLTSKLLEINTKNTEAN